MDYTKFNVEDFAANESFIDWVNQSDPEAVKYWDLYISTHPEIRDTVERARILVLNLKYAEKNTHDAVALDAMWNQIQKAVDAPQEKRLNRNMARRLVLASLVFVCGAAIFWFVVHANRSVTRSGYFAEQQDTSDFIEHVNQTDKPQKIQLADGSTVMLGAKSTLKYRDDYDKDSTRNVYLFGEGFFDVVKNPFKPFIVHSNEVFVKVLGTSFRVTAPENGSNVVVAVKTGKVSVYAMKLKGAQDKKDGVILLPNQQVSYERKDQSFAKTLVDAPEILETTITESDFVFENEPIANVFTTLEKAYGIEIIFNEDTMKKCYLTVPLGKESMQEKLRIICQAIGADYEVIDANIVINSSGCQ